VPAALGACTHAAPLEPEEALFSALESVFAAGLVASPAGFLASVSGSSVSSGAVSTISSSAAATKGGVGLDALGFNTLDFVVPHVLVHVFPSGKHGGFGRLFVHGVAVFNAAQPMAAGAADRAGIGFSLHHFGIGQQGLQIASSEQQAQNEYERTAVMGTQQAV